MKKMREERRVEGEKELVFLGSLSFQLTSCLIVRNLSFHTKIRYKARIFLLTTPFGIILGALANTVKE